MSNSNIDPNVTGSQETADKTDSPNYVTKEEFTKVLNSAITNHLKRLDISKQISESLEGSLASFKEQFAAPKTEEKVNSSKSNESPEISNLQKKLEAMEKQMKVKEEALQARERQAREKDAFARVRSELGTFGVRPEAIDTLSKVIKAENRIKVDEEGNISFLEDDDNEVDLKEGLKTYLDPKRNPAIGLFLPPKQNNKVKSNVSVRSTNVGAQDNQNLSFRDKAALAAQQIRNLNKK